MKDLIRKQWLESTWLSYVSPKKRRFNFRVSYFEELEIRFIVGFPISLCRIETFPKNHIIAEGISICHPNDMYNWRTGVKVALGDALDAYMMTYHRYNEAFRRFCYEKLFEVYPELKETNG